MTTAEERELMAKIGELAGKVNRAKNQRAGITSTPAYQRPAPYPSNHTHGWQRGGYSTRGYRGGHAGVRHRHLTLDNTTTTSANGNSGGSAETPTTSWISKTDRHTRQIINPAVYEQTTNVRARAIEQSRRLQATDPREHKRFIMYVTQTNHDGGFGNGNYEVTVDGIRFQVAKNGSKLVRVPDENNAIGKPTPQIATVGGVKFYRSKNGNLYRQGVVTAQRRNKTVKINIPCQIFTTTGSCALGPRCRYTHDASRVAACKDLLMKGSCPSGDACDLSHDLVPERTPTCLHFLRGNCTKPDCKYAHVKVSPGALVCRAFGLYGYCDKGAACSERHVYECPDFSNTGKCKRRDCRLPHRERASVLRRTNTGGDAKMADLSSDDGSDDEDDVDSDEVDEFIGADDAYELDMAEQRDFISL